MDKEYLSTVVNWGTLLVWFVSALLYVGRLYEKRARGEKIVPTWMAKLLSSNVILGIVITVGLTGSMISMAVNHRHPAKNLPAPTETIYAKTFFNETLDIDGKIYDHCTFNNVTLFFHGTANWSFIEAKFDGRTALRTDDPAAKAFVALDTAIQRLPATKAMQQFTIDEHGNLTPSGPRLEKGPRPSSPDSKKEQ